MKIMKATSTLSIALIALLCSMVISPSAVAHPVDDGGPGLRNELVQPTGTDTEGGGRCQVGAAGRPGEGGPAPDTPGSLPGLGGQRRPLSRPQ